MSLVLIERSFDEPLTEERMQAIDRRVAPCLQERGAEWCYSFLSSDRRRLICVFTAPDAESVRESFRKAGNAFERIWSADMLTPEESELQLK